MYKVGMYLRVRKACFVEGMSVREAARVFGLHRDTVRKMLEYSVPPGYRRQRPARRPQPDPYRGVIDQILEQDRTPPDKRRPPAHPNHQPTRTTHHLHRTPFALVGELASRPSCLMYLHRTPFQGESSPIVRVSGSRGELHHIPPTLSGKTRDMCQGCAATEQVDISPC